MDVSIGMNAWICLLSAIFTIFTFCDAELQKRCELLKIKYAKVKVIHRGRAARVNCYPPYLTLGGKFVLCEQGEWEKPLPKCIKPGCLPMNLLVPNSEITRSSYKGALIEITCKPGYNLTGNSVFSCDGYRWNDTTPSCYLPKETTKKCDFESGDMCNWVNDPRNDFNWTLHSMATPSGHLGTGPESDHTLGPGLNGHYLYLESSSPHKSNDVARLVSPYLSYESHNTSICFVFWYHMYGATTGTLTVYIGNMVAFNEVGNHGNRWFKGIVPINTTSPLFQITIVGTRGNGYLGDIAIDDFKIAEGSECDGELDSLDTSLRGSCNGRCDSNLLTDVDNCYCQEACLVNATCCTDFLESCGIEFGTEPLWNKSYVSVTQSESYPKISNLSTIKPPHSSDVVFTTSTISVNPVFPHTTEHFNQTVTKETSIEKTLVTNPVDFNNLTTLLFTTLLLKNDNILNHTSTTPETVSNLPNFNGSITKSLITKTYNVTYNSSLNKTMITTVSPLLRYTEGRSTLKFNNFTFFKPVQNFTKLPMLRFVTPTVEIVFRAPKITPRITGTTIKIIVNVTRDNTDVRLVNESATMTKRPSDSINTTINTTMNTTINTTQIYKSTFLTTKFAKFTSRNIVQINPNNVPLFWPVTTGKIKTYPTFSTTVRTTGTKSSTTLALKNVTLPWRKDPTPLTFPVIPPKSIYIRPTISPVIKTKVQVNTWNVNTKNDVTASTWRAKYMNKGNHASYTKEEDNIVKQSTIFGSAFCVILVLIIVFTYVCVVHKRKIKRNSAGDDDSVVQFLTSEVINFHLARPSPERQRNPEERQQPQPYISLREK